MAAFDYRSVMKPKSFLTLFNPNTETIKKDFNGNTYTFPAGDTVEVGEAVSKSFDKEANPVYTVIPVEEVVAHFIGEDGVSGALGALGVRVLSGDPETDEQIKSEASQVFKQRCYINDLEITGAHMAAMRVAKESGNPVPTPDKHVIDAYNRIEAYQAGGNAALPFNCPECNRPFLKAEEVATHQEAQHKGAPVQAQSSDSALQAQLAASAAQVAALTELVTKLVAKESAPKNKGGRPRKVQESAA